MSLTKQLLAAIENSGATLYRISKDSGVPYVVLYRFANGQRQIKLDTADKLTEYFQMRLTAPKKVNPKGK